MKNTDKLTFEKIQIKIDNKKAELAELNKQLDEAGKAKYNFLIGKCYSLAETCQIKVLSIYSIDERYDSVSVECIRIQGGKYDNGRIEVDINGDYDLKFIDINEQRITEVSIERFNEFLIEALETTKETLIKPV